ncbi:GH25 family lysozyme [Streptomyces leeuwenhoekii]|uniref:GH25 family lysozyme n=1 Tax=Streptomyces leeuwenhoekii TaxID=1437453 RepID=UPI0036FB9950
MGTPRPAPRVRLPRGGPGTAYEDPWFARDFKAASATSLLRAPYHFFGPQSTRDGAARADHFVRTARAAGYAGTRAGELPPVLDVEASGPAAGRSAPGACAPHSYGSSSNG